MRKAKNIVPSVTISNTQAQSNDPGITYNQSNVTYNASAYTYGGVYGFQDVFPLISKVSTYPIISKSAKTDSYIQTTTTTYNEATVTYDLVNQVYGGLYGFRDVIPLISKVFTPRPMIARADDIYTTPAPAPIGGSGFLIGMLGITYP